MTAIATMTATETVDTVPTVANHVTLLPPNLVHLAKLANKDSGRYAISGVKLSAAGDGNYKAESTNGKVLGIVTGSNGNDANDYPRLPVLAAAPNSGTSAIIPQDSWVEAFKLVPKPNRTKPLLGNAAVVIGQEVVTFAATNLDRTRSLETRNLEGRFPNTSSVLPTDAPAASVKIDANLLIELLKVATEFSQGDNGHVTLELRGNRPVVIRTQTTANGGQEFTGVIMPLA